MRIISAICLLVFVLASVSGCVFERRRDGGLTIRPIHIH